MFSGIYRIVGGRVAHYISFSVVSLALWLITWRVRLKRSGTRPLRFLFLFLLTDGWMDGLMDGWMFRGRFTPSAHPFSSPPSFSSPSSPSFPSCSLVGYPERASAAKRIKAVAVSFFSSSARLQGNPSSIISIIGRCFWCHVPFCLFVVFS